MDRDKLILEVKKKIEEENIKTVNKNSIEQVYRKLKNGIYVLYNSDSEVIYVGKFGRGKKTSFYHRMYAHGSGKHENKEWFKEVASYRVKIFENLNNKELEYIERLMILEYRPLYNDKYIKSEDYEKINNRL